MVVMLCPLMVLPSGCALVQGDKQTVSVTTDKPAKITVDGQLVGETKGNGELLMLPPLTRKDEHLVVAQGEGLEARKNFTTTLSPLGILDVIGIFFFLLPGITLLTGHAFMLEPENLNLQLQPAASQPEPVETPKVLKK
ncbi:MAG: hypothetical protein U1E76_18485 [Planctomycetota bacterium]